MADGRGDVWVSAPFGAKIEPPPPWSASGAEPGTAPATFAEAAGTTAGGTEAAGTTAGGAEAASLPSPPGRTDRPVPAFAPVPPPPLFRQPTGPRRWDPDGQAPARSASEVPRGAGDALPAGGAGHVASVAPTAEPTVPAGTAGPSSSPPSGTGVSLELTQAQLDRLLALLERPVAVPGPLTPTPPAPPMPPAPSVAAAPPAPPGTPVDEWQAALRQARREAEEARAVAVEMHRRLLNATVDQERERYRQEGVPPELLDLAEPLLRAETGDHLDIGAIARRMLDFVRDHCAGGSAARPPDVQRLVARWEREQGPPDR